jgi:hypothetical protein
MYGGESTGKKARGKKYGRRSRIRVVAPTCADDIALLVSTQSEAQALLDIVSDITSKDLVKINPSKSELVPPLNLSIYFPLKFL